MSKTIVLADVLFLVVLAGCSTAPASDCFDKVYSWGGYHMKQTFCNGKVETRAYGNPEDFPKPVIYRHETPRYCLPDAPEQYCVHGYQP